MILRNRLRLAMLQSNKLVGAITVCLILLQQTATAQGDLKQSMENGLTENSIWADFSEAGKRISYAVADAYMTTIEEHALGDCLLRWDDTDWRGKSLGSIVTGMQQFCPVWINQMELDREGVGMDLLQTVNVPAGPIGVRLQSVLTPNDLAYQLRGRRLEITSRSGAEDSPVIRTYDVTPLAANHVSIQSNPSFTELIMQIIEPDSWLYNGGNSTIHLHALGDRRLLTVSTSYQTQLQIHCFLNQLNGSLARANREDGKLHRQWRADAKQLSVVHGLLPERKLPEFDPRVLPAPF
ncbi:MAG: hypothetical protein KDB03_23665 [Planctomycetales bacterium]|nr:hypothetical protein [Planctomycetales bacterium]